MRRFLYTIGVLITLASCAILARAIENADDTAGSWTAEQEVEVVLPAGEPPQQVPHTEKGVSRGTRESDPEPKPNVAAGEQEDAEPADASKTTMVAGDQSPITQVIVYSDRADITRQVSIEMAQGVNEVIFWNITSSLMRDSVRVTGQGRATIVEVAEKFGVRNQVQIANLTAMIKLLRERVSEEQSRTTEVTKKLDLQLSRLTTEKELVVGMVRRAAMGESEGLSATLQGMKAAGWDSLPAMLAFHREQVTRLDEEMAEVEATKVNTTKMLQALQDRMRLLEKELRLYQKTHYSEVVVLLDAEVAGTVVLDMKYAVYGARWTASYDCRAETSSASSVQLTYQAEVTQTTGEDWKGAEVKLSTTAPSIGGDVPDLHAHTLSFYEPEAISFSAAMERSVPLRRAKRMSRGYGVQAASAKAFKYAAEEEEDLAEDAEIEMASGGMMDAPMAEPVQNIGMSSTTVSEGGMGAMFTITRRATIPSDNRPHKVVIGVVELEPKFEYIAVPRASPQAYLTMRAINQSPYPLLPGPVKAFLDGGASGSSSFKLVHPREEFQLSFGVDDGVKVKEIAVPKKDETTGVMFLSESKKRTVTHISSIKNNKQVPVTITVRDSVPQSTHKDIKVNLEDKLVTKKGDGSTVVKFTYNEDSGKLEWQCILQPGQEQKLQVKYTIQWPKDKELNGL